MVVMMSCLINIMRSNILWGSVNTSMEKQIKEDKACVLLVLVYIFIRGQEY